MWQHRKKQLIFACEEDAARGKAAQVERETGASEGRFQLPSLQLMFRRSESWVYVGKLLHTLAGREMFGLSGQGPNQKKAWLIAALPIHPK